MTERLTGRRVIVTGGHRKLGFAIAKRFVAEGASVLVVGRDQEQVTAALEELGSSARGLALDLTAASAAADLMKHAESELGGPPEVLVNAAGVFLWKGFLDIAPEDWQRTIDTQLTVPFLLTQAFARARGEKGAGGSVINIGSIHGPVGDGNVVPQCAAKAGLLGLTRASAEALRGSGIRVNAIVAGAIKGDTPEQMSEGLGGWITQGDLAGMATYLASDDAAGITGAAMEAYGVTRPVVGSEKK